ncbi:MAG: glutamate--tRNA ligase, partial [Dehalococcoidia bacterium]
MNQSIRVRYAPSPTGMPHVGNIRTALFNWLFARHHGGTFIVRIEDTDASRKVEGALEDILESLRWLGLDWDEGPEVGGECGPYFQSQRLDLYQKHARQLVEAGHAYPCFCSPQRLDDMRREQTQRKQPPGYDRHCRELPQGEIDRLRDGGTVPVVRFKIPLQGQTNFGDLIRGDVTFENSTLDDFVILKSDGYPTYHLANVVDDHLMRISHVLRADEWLSSTPKHKLLYDALDYKPPYWAHLPMILGPDRAKLSKRHGAASLTEFRDRGYLPQAMTNFLALLGWSLDDRTELMDRKELVEHFSLERVGKTGAIFGMDKLDWMNGVYLRKLTTPELTDLAMPFLERDLASSIPRPLDREYVLRIMPLLQERIRTLGKAHLPSGDAPSGGELPELAEFFFPDNLQHDPERLRGKKLSPEGAREALGA